MITNINKISYATQVARFICTNFSLALRYYMEDCVCIVIDVDGNEYYYERTMFIEVEEFMKKKTMYQIYTEYSQDEKNDDEILGGIIIRKVDWNEYKDRKEHAESLRNISKEERQKRKKEILEKGPAVEENIIFVDKSTSKSIIDFIEQNDSWISKGINITQEVVENDYKSKWYEYFLYKTYDWGHIQSDWIGGMSVKTEKYIDELIERLEFYLSNYAEKFDYEASVMYSILPKYYNEMIWNRNDKMTVE